MARFRFHKLAALVVLVGFAAWVGTGKFSSVGSAQNEAAAKPADGRAAQGRAAHRRRHHAAARPACARHPHFRPDRGRQARRARHPRRAASSTNCRSSKASTSRRGDLIMRARRRGQARRRRDGRAAWSRSARPSPTPPSGWPRAATRRSCSPTQARSALATAKSQLEAAQAELDQIRNLRAVQRHRRPGARRARQLRHAGRRGRDAAQSRPGAGASAKSASATCAYLKLGDEADIRLVNGKTVKGTVRYISRDASAPTRTFRIEVAIPNPRQAHSRPA